VNRRVLLAAGVIVTLLGSLTIEASFLLLLTPIPTEALANTALVGIGLCGIGVALLLWGRRRA
jgi:hypothetical protein